MRYLIVFIISLFFVSCDVENKKVISDLKLSKIRGDKSWEEVLNQPMKVIYFLSPECPLCQNYAVAMRDLEVKFPKVEFIGVFPGKEYSELDIRKYLIRFELNFNAFFDKEFELTNTLGAEITPEAFLLDSNGNVLYSGAIDNWAISLGQKRTVITKRYLEEAIESSLNSQEISIKKSNAVGCFIQ